MLGTAGLRSCVTVAASARFLALGCVLGLFPPAAYRLGVFSVAWPNLSYSGRHVAGICASVDSIVVALLKNRLIFLNLYIFV